MLLSGIYPGGMWKEKELLAKEPKQAILQNSINPGFLPNLHRETLSTIDCSLHISITWGALESTDSWIPLPPPGAVGLG